MNSLKHATYGLSARTAKHTEAVEKCERTGRPRPAGDQSGRVIVAGGVAAVRRRELLFPPRCCPAASCPSNPQRAA